MENSDEYEHGHPAGPSRALIAVLAGLAVLVVGTLALPYLIAQQPLERLLIGGAVAALVLWLLGWAYAIRRASALWQAGSFALLIAAGVAGGFGASRLFHADVSRDASSFAEAEIGSDGSLTLAGRGQRGPLSQQFAASLAEGTNDQRDYDTRLAKARLGSLNSPYLLSKDIDMLDKCADIGALKQAAEAKSGRDRARADALVRAIAATNLSPDLKRGMSMMADPLPADANGQDPRLAPETELLDATQALCTLLARRNWSDNMGYFAFSNAADNAAFKALDEQRRRAAGAITDLDRAAKQRVSEGRDTVRDALS